MKISNIRTSFPDSILDFDECSLETSVTGTQRDRYQVKGHPSRDISVLAKNGEQRFSSEMRRDMAGDYKGRGLKYGFG